MGGGAQMINWPEGFCAELVSRGVQVIRFDSRDTARSSHVTDAPVPDLQEVGSPGFEFDEAAVADRAGRSWDRGHDPLGMLRQSVAVLASGDRTAELRSLRVPTLVLHGADDLMCDVSGGRATAAAIPGAERLRPAPALTAVPAGGPAVRERSA